MLDSKTGVVALLLPTFEVARLSSQQGCFLFNGNPLLSFADSLAFMMKDASEPWLYRIGIPDSLRAEFLRRLMHHNVHPAALFPDIEGLGRFLRLKEELFSSGPAAP